MNRKVPSSTREGKKSIQVNQITFLRLNKKKSFQVRFLAPLCRPVFSVVSPFTDYCSFVIDRADNKIKMFEFSGSIFECLKSFMESRGYCTEIEDPGDSIHGGEWEIYWDRVTKQWLARVIRMEELSKKDRKLIHQFVSDVSQPFVKYEHLIKDMIEPVCDRTENLIPLH
jgi:hypothetical protein